MHLGSHFKPKHEHTVQQAMLFCGRRGANKEVICIAIEKENFVLKYS